MCGGHYGNPQFVCFSGANSPPKTFRKPDSGRSDINVAGSNLFSHSAERIGDLNSFYCECSGAFWVLRFSLAARSSRCVSLVFLQPHTLLRVIQITHLSDAPGRREFQKIQRSPSSSG